MRYDLEGKELQLKNSGNELDCTNALLKIMLCSKLHCQKVLNRNYFPTRLADRGERGLLLALRSKIENYISTIYELEHRPSQRSISSKIVHLNDLLGTVAYCGGRPW